MVETKCGCRFLWLKLDTWPRSAILDFRLLLGVLGKFSQQGLRLTSRQNSPGTTGDEAETIP